jgi:hypothetical protein
MKYPGTLVEIDTVKPSTYITPGICGKYDKGV